MHTDRFVRIINKCILRKIMNIISYAIFFNVKAVIVMYQRKHFKFKSDLSNMECRIGIVERLQTK